MHNAIPAILIIHYILKPLTRDTFCAISELVRSLALARQSHSRIQSLTQPETVAQIRAALQRRDGDAIERLLEPLREHADDDPVQTANLCIFLLQILHGVPRETDFSSYRTKQMELMALPTCAQRVEYAIKMPGADGGSVWLPIDSKFPGDTYAHLQDAQASGDAQAVENARHALELVLRSEAKDIREKYVEPPYTTAFGILFLPFEGLYAEVVNAGLLEVLQRDYQVNVAGPSTMAALLNSLQMGFKTLAIQKRSGEVWQLLGAVKTEFDKFGQGLSKMQQRLRQTDEELDNLIGVRSRAISRKLRAVQTMDESAAAALLELDTEPGRPVAARLPENGEE